MHFPHAGAVPQLAPRTAPLIPHVTVLHHASPPEVYGAGPINLLLFAEKPLRILITSVVLGLRMHQ